MGHFDPHAPSVLGGEWPALYERDVPLDAGVEYGQTFESRSAEQIAYAFPYLSQPPSSTYRFHLLVNVYEKGDELATGPEQRTLVPCNGGTLDFDASLVNGASIAECLGTAADDKYIDLGDQGNFHVEFATAGLFDNKRILRLVLHHAIENVDPDAENPELGSLLALDVPAKIIFVSYGFLQCDRTVRTTDLGEIYPQPLTGTILTNTQRTPWKPADVQALDTAAVRFWMLGPSDGAGRRVHYVALEVVWCEENRVAVGARRFGSGDSAREAIANEGFQTVQLTTPDGLAAWPKPDGGEFTVTVGLADGGGPYLDAPGSDIESFGPAPSVRLLDSFALFAPHEGRAIPRGLDNEPLTADPVTAMPGMILSTASFVASSDPQPYAQQMVAPVYIGVGAVQDIIQDADGSAVAYPWVRFWARRFGSGDFALAVTCGGTAVSMTAGELDALTEIIDGWRYVVLKFPTAPVVNGSGTALSVAFWSSAPIADRWEILGALAVSETGVFGPTYGGTRAAATHDGTRDTTADLAVSLAIAAPQVSGLTATPRSLIVPGLGAS